MTDKVIIDGVNVTECEFFYPYTDKCSISNKWYNKIECKRIPNCYYKQLQRTQQQYNQVVEQNKSLQEAIKTKEQECEELRKMLNNPEVRVALIDVQTGEREVWRKLGRKADRYKQALNKIEEIANIHTTVHCLNPDCDCNNCHDEITDYGKTCINKGRQEILNIINDVKE